MAKSVNRAKILAKLKSRTKGAWKSSRDKEAAAKGGRLPGGIVRGVAQLRAWRLGETKKGDPMYEFKFVCLEPAEYAGVKFSHFHFIKASTKKTVKDKTDDLSNDVQLMGGETEGTTEETLCDVLDDLCKEKPYVYFDTWMGTPSKQYPNPSVNVSIQGKADDFEPPEEEDDEEVDEDEDEDAEEEEETDEDEEGEEEEAEEKPRKKPGKKPAKKPSRKPKKEEEEEEEETEDEEDEDEDAEEEDNEEAEEEEADIDPQVDDVWNYKPGPKAKLEEYVVTKVSKKTQTVDLKRVRDKKVFPKVPWDKLEGAAE